MKNHDGVAIHARFFLEPGRGVVKRPEGHIGLRIQRGRVAEKIGVRLPRREAAQVLQQFPDQVRASPRISPMQRRIGVELAIQVVMVQPMDDPIGAHRQSLHRRARPADIVVQPAVVVEQVVRRVVRDHEQRMLPGADDEDGQEGDGKREPVGQRDGRRQRDDREVEEDWPRRAPHRALRQCANEIGGERFPGVAGKRFPEIVLELLACHLSRPPTRTYFTSINSSRP